MNLSSYSIARMAADQARAALSELRQAGRDCAPYAGAMNLALDDRDNAAGMYRRTLRALGVPEVETRGLSAGALKAILKHLPLPGAPQPFRRSDRGMAFDSSRGNSTLASILKDVPAPINMSPR